MESLFNADVFAIDIETTGLTRSSEIVSAAISWHGPDNKIKSKAFLLDRWKAGTEGPDQEFQNILKRTLLNANCHGIALFHNAPFDLKLLLLRYGHLIDETYEDGHFPLLSHQICTIVDTLAISRLMKNNKYTSHADPDQLKCHSLKFLAKEFFSSDYSDEDPKLKRPTTYEAATEDKNIRLANETVLLNYNMEDTQLTLRLFKELKNHLSQNEWNYFSKREKSHILNVVHLSWYGVPFDKIKSQKLADKIIGEIEALERKIFKALGREINLTSQQQLGQALFNNPKLTYTNSEKETQEPISPLFKTENGQAMVDLDTLDILRNRIRKQDSKSNAPALLTNVMAHIELTKNLSKIEHTEKYAIREGDFHFIYPNISASAKSGRNVVSSPNLLGLPKKVFKKSYTEEDGIETNGDEIKQLYENFKEDSIRDLISVAPAQNGQPKSVLVSIDISGLDLVVVAQGAKAFCELDEFYWLKFLRRQGVNRDKIPDPHFSILQKLELEIDLDEKKVKLFEETFKPLADNLTGDLKNYWALKATQHTHDELQAICRSDLLAISVPNEKGRIEGIEFVHRLSGKSEFVPFPNDGGRTKKDLEFLREFSKKLNLATSYLIGAPGLAVKLSEVTKGLIYTLQAQEVLDKFYAVFPEIRLFQDQIGNLIYSQGYAESLYGRSFYAETWDDLNEHRREQTDGPGQYEFIIRWNSKFWCLKAHDWVKQELPVIKNLRATDGISLLRFKKISAIEELDPDIFRKKKKEKKKSKFSHKTEDQLDEFSDLELNRIAMTCEIDHQVQVKSNMNAEATILLGSFLVDGDFQIPEKLILFYRVKLKNPSWRYFKKYTKLLRAVKAFFPMYCQGIATSVAKICLTHVRERIEKELPEARIVFFIHDEIVLQVPNEPTKLTLAEEILQDSVENEEIKLPFDLSFTGKFKILGEHF
jgi:hypothetical protein